MPELKMLILRGIAGHYSGRDWPRGALDEPPALEYARRRGYAGKCWMWRARPARTVRRPRWPWLSFIATRPLPHSMDSRAAATTCGTSSTHSRTPIAPASVDRRAWCAENSGQRLQGALGIGLSLDPREATWPARARCSPNCLDEAKHAPLQCLPSHRVPASRNDPNRAACDGGPRSLSRAP